MDANLGHQAPGTRHLLVSEPEHGNLAEAMHYLKLSFSKRAKSLSGPRLASKRWTRTWGTKLAMISEEREESRKVLDVRHPIITSASGF
jgi:hypothetical protein